jgi:hypothetical protein
MDTSVFLAQLIGPVLVLVSIAMLLRPQSVSDMMQTLAAGQGQVWVFVLGIFALVAGLAMVVIHNVWDGTWRVIITLIGWMILLKGAVRLLAPDWALRTSSIMVSNKKLMQAFIFLLLLIGLYLSYRGFIV